MRQNFQENRGNLSLVDSTLKRMASTGTKEIAVVDSDGRILADITAVDLLKYSES